MGVKRAVVPLTVERDTTLRWSCREGAFVLWIRSGNILAAPQHVTVDVWSLRDGDWLRPKFGKKAERETLRERLQIELGFGVEDEE